jgi:predicted membrane channel-forming protein YqfA (hemolysin III family)
MNAKVYASCLVILIVWSVALVEIIQKTSWLNYVGELSTIAVLIVCWLTLILAPLNLGKWKTNLGE